MATEAWRVLSDGKMIEVVNGERDGRELTSIVILGAGQVIRKPLTKEFVQRWASGDEYARSLVEHGEVSTETVTDLVDEDGNDLPDEEREVFTPTAGPGDAGEEKAAPTGDPDAVERATAAEADLADAQSTIKQLEDEVDGLKADLAAAQEAATAPQAVPYDRLTPEALQAEADKRGVTPESGSGKDGNVVKADLVKALQEADAK